MKSFITTLSLAAGAYASCCTFELTASGGQSGTIGQLDDGQNRIGGGLPPANFTICNGSITDDAGRGCLLTPEVEQFQCDLNKSPISGFSIESNGTLEYSGSSVFYACPASDTEWNLYTTPVAGQLKCVEIGLTASGCGAQATCSSTPASTVTSISTVTEATTVTESITVTVSECEATSTPVSVPSSTAPLSSTIITLPTETLPTQTASSTPAPQSTSTVVPPPQSVSSGSITYTQSATTVVPPPESVSSTSVSESTTCTESLSTSTVVTIATSTHVTSPSYTWTSSSIPLSTGPTTLYTTTHTTPPKSTHTPHYSNTTAPTSTTTSAATCVSLALTGTYTAGNYQYPHLIVPVSSTSPDTAYGTQYFGTISSNTSTIFNFDIPSSYAGHTCNLIFLLPLQSQLETSSYEFSGSGEVDFEKLSSPATSSTTYDNAPSVSADLGDFTLTEGSSTLISSFACPAGQTVSYEAKAVGDTYLYFFQDYNPSPLGLYITYC